MKIVRFAICLMFILLAVACSKNDGSKESSSSDKTLIQNSMDGSPKSKSSAMDTKKSETNLHALDKRMIIYHADMEVRVNDLKSAQSSIEQELNRISGYIVKQDMYETEDYAKEGTLEIRVPQTSYQSFIGEISSLEGLKVIRKSIQGDDVTEEYVDLSSRLKAKQAVENRLYDFLKKAQKTEDLLQISRDLGTVQEEIEGIKGRMQYLQKNTEMSSITLHITESKVIVPDIRSKDFNTWERSKQSFVKSIQGLLSLGSGLMVFLIGGSPILVPILLIAGGIWYFIRKRRSNNTSG